ncbi:hypothetical protein OG301_35295 [Streptomyces platensis]|uniref:hypothetical protein n=1 Tax=Streptomyces platensis TaxID=58346 RepID=UPI002E7FC591|nr:hypothetical protein [Streptomyces platensis]WTI56189.1 hypothetical protein OG301_35295 [Streptomyces platensis]WUB78291.1 hypothetical protein OG424_03285 [Streptomyces platensis]
MGVERRRVEGVENTRFSGPVTAGRGDCVIMAGQARPAPSREREITGSTLALPVIPLLDSADDRIFP